MSDAHAPAGWYPVAEGSTQLRYWDGIQWTEHTHDPEQARAQAQAQAVQQAAAQQAAAQQLAAQHAAAGIAQQQWQQPAYVATQPVAPEGTRPNTIMGWLNAATPVLLLVDLIPLYFWMSNLFAGINLTTTTDPNELIAREFTPTYAVILLLGLVATVLFIVFAALDWRTLRRRNVPAPFHWAWSFFTLVSLGGLVYVIGRAVVARRRTGTSAYGPMILYIVLIAVTIVATLFLTISWALSLQHQFGDQFSTSGGVA